MGNLHLPPDENVITMAGMAHGDQMWDGQLCLVHCVNAQTVKWPLQRNSRLKLHLDSAYCMQVLPTVKKVVGTKY